MKRMLLFLAVMLAQLSGTSQQNVNIIVPKRNTFYLEAFGQGIFNSLSFDRLYRTNKKIKTSLTIGITIWNPKNSTEHYSAFGAPVSYNWIFGKNNHHLELGAGLSYMKITQQFDYGYDTKTYADHLIYFTPKVSYRYQVPEGGLFFRLSLTPPIGLMTKTSFGGEYYLNNAYTPNKESYALYPLWLGMSLGWTIK